MELIVSLIMVPCVAALLMLVVRADKARDVLCVAFAFRRAEFGRYRNDA